MGTLKINDTKKFLEAVDFALAIKKEDNFLGVLARLCNVANNQDGDISVMNDFEPYSFTFSITKIEDKSLILHGGWIYHGPLPDGLVGGASSIQLVPSVGWTLHT